VLRTRRGDLGEGGPLSFVSFTFYAPIDSVGVPMLPDHGGVACVFARTYLGRDLVPRAVRKRERAEQRALALSRLCLIRQ
jgi:hypothetical protein